jgi:uncharacterized membrane protein YhhN
MVFLIAAAVALRASNEEARWSLTLAALGFSLLGDVFLMLRRERFLAGLWSFLFAHLAYVLAFDTLAVDGATVAVGAIVLTGGSVLMIRMIRGMQRRGQGALAIPVCLYQLSIAAMVTSALLTPFRDGWDGPHAAMAIAGAVLFMTSDGLIGWTRFVKDYPWGKVAIAVTYHVAQALLVLALLA